MFGQAGCETCHTLGAAGSRGAIGPSLDVRRPPVDRVVSQVREGGGGMPAYADRLSDEEIDAVAAYVAEVAGR
ncbi:MAG: cytochrome c [Actinomycetota bacterium]|nr:cytochrome c [Actinomycetota bacterium]